MFDLASLLDTATRAALDAGALIRAEFHRPGGPRHSDAHHADVDTEAEELIRARLLPALPDAGYVGEETSPNLASRNRATWFVDPNDGTKAFLEGWRGSAVSIGLVVGELPVLGVVYAPLAPDDRGDLVTWAEGLPLMRNGVRVDRRPLPSSLSATDVVLVSQAADSSPAANAACCAPAKFRKVVGIAYRLALVAVGEGEACVSLNGPGPLDYAGGHALLRAIDGDLVDAAGRPIRYGTGASGSYAVFGGQLRAATELSKRDWSKVRRQEAARTVAGLDLVLPGEPRCAGAGVLARAQGTLLGQLAGDSLGSLVEFQTPQQISSAYPSGVRELVDGGTWNTLAGQPTDDSEMALVLARSLATHGVFDVERVRIGYRAWLDSGPFDSGATTRAGLSGRPNPESQANGALMRISPLGVFGQALPPEQLARWARDDAAITHPHRVCLDVSALFAVAIAFAVRTGANGREVYEYARAWAEEQVVDPAVLATLNAAATELPADFMKQMGWVRIAFQNAFFQLLHAESFEEALVDTVGRGGDTDTNGAIAGALLGAVHGREGIPLRWRRVLQSCRALAGHHPRPRTFWPCDALELAERLVARGAARRIM